VAWPAVPVAVLRALFTVTVYGMIVFGGFVKVRGPDHSLTFAHHVRAFSVGWDGGIRWTGVAWDSFRTTMEIAPIAAPLIAAVGLPAARLIVRQRFPGRAAFESMLMTSFAIPGTVIGTSHVMAFNLPPPQMTGTAPIPILCFVFRNMPVGMAAMARIDGSLDEASLTPGAGSARSMRRVVLPPMRPAILAALVYGFVRAITSIPAVIFLVSAGHDMATAYIVGLVGEYGAARSARSRTPP
jgi:iron(III) transport system permease protein